VNLHDDVASLLRPMVARERAHPDTKRDLGGVFFRDRIQAVARLVSARTAGDLLEIGVYNGGTGVLLAEVAAASDRRYLGLDSFLPHPDYRHDEMEPIAREALTPFGLTAEIVKIDAHSEEGVALVKSRPWCFALSDDGHRYEDHRCELWALAEAMAGGGVVAVDDLYVPDVMLALNDFLRDHADWKLVNETLGLREYYVVKEPKP